MAESVSESELREPGETGMGIAEAGPGDFIYVPPFVPHQEINANPKEPLECGWAAHRACSRIELAPLSARRAAEQLNRQGIPAPAGGWWFAAQVIRVRQSLRGGPEK